MKKKNLLRVGFEFLHAIMKKRKEIMVVFPIRPCAKLYLELSSQKMTMVASGRKKKKEKKIIRKAQVI